MKGKKMKFTGNFGALNSVVRKSYWEIDVCAEFKVDKGKYHGDICKQNNVHS